MGAWNRLPLRTQLTAVFVALLGLGLVLSGVTAVSLLARTLVGQLDTQLASAAPELLRAALRGARDDDDRVLPSDYHVVVAGTDGVVEQVLTTSLDAGAAPDLPSLTAEEVSALAGEAFTVTSLTERTRWRVLALPLVSRDDAVIGSVSVALPMSAADATLRRMRLALVAIAAAVVALGVLAGRWGVRRSLRPLGEIEDTAAAIAAGDLTRRVPERPSSTEVGRLGAALNGMLAQIEHAFAARSASEERMRRFVADASHELRTPLATIRGYGELYRMGALREPGEVDLTVRRIEDSATRMGSLVEDLLHLARLDEGRPQRQDPVDLVVLAADAVADLHALDRERVVRLVPAVAGGRTAGAITTGDEARLRQVVANLVGNVVQHTPAGSPVELAVGRSADEVVLEVRDHGPGIAPEHAARVFERFYRVDAARGRDSGGAGLGMAIVAAIVEAHRGRVELTGTPGGGTTVRVALPASSDAPEVYDDDSLSPTE